jgi:hypothetical protein
LVLEHRGGPVHATRDDDGRPALRQILAQAAGELHEAAALGPSGLSGHLKHDGSRARDQGQNVVRSLEGGRDARISHAGQLHGQRTVGSTFAIVDDEDLRHCVHDDTLRLDATDETGGAQLTSKRSICFIIYMNGSSTIGVCAARSG